MFWSLGLRVALHPDTPNLNPKPYIPPEAVNPQTLNPKLLNFGFPINTPAAACGISEYGPFLFAQELYMLMFFRFRQRPTKPQIP